MASAATQAFGALSDEPVTAGAFDARSVVRELSVVGELSAVADYIKHIKREFGALLATPTRPPIRKEALRQARRELLLTARRTTASVRRRTASTRCSCNPAPRR
jgi:hypothetical protein